MLEIVFAIAIFSYSIFLIGLIGILYHPIIILFTVLYWIIFSVVMRRHIFSTANTILQFSYSPIMILSLAYLILQAVVNSIGLFGPEISFDAMWYHLTLPKLYLIYHAVIYFPGHVLYYSAMPRLTEMLYTAGLAFGSDFWPRGIHFLFGILTCVVLYRLGRKFFSPKWTILLPVIFYSNLVVGWESFSGYIDLSRTFFATFALYAFFEWTEKKERKWFIASAFAVGLTIATKLLALPDVIIYIIAFFFFEKKSLSLSIRLKRVLSFVILLLVPAIPWFIFSYIHTGNPIFPMLSPAYQVKGYWQDVLNPLSLLQFSWDTFAKSSDPINPIFLAVIPFIIYSWKKIWKEVPLLFLFTMGGLAAWYFTPQTGGGRYILPYLSAFSVLCIFTIRSLSKKWHTVFLLFLFFVASISLAYRLAANVKFLPVIFHKESKTHFIAAHLQYNLGDFYDIDGYFSKHIKPTDMVLLYGFHNLYYVNFPFILNEWAKKGDAFNYVAVQGDGMPERFHYWNLIYFNTTTQVRLYSLQGKSWLF